MLGRLMVAGVVILLCQIGRAQANAGKVSGAGR